MQNCSESYRHLLGCLLPVRLGLLPPAEAAGGAHLSEGLHWGSQALSEALQQPHVSTLCLNINRENYFCQQWTPRLSPAINCSDSYQVANPGQTISAWTDGSLSAEKGGQPRTTTIPTASLICGCGKRSRKTRDRRGWTGLLPLDWQDGFACPIPLPKKGQSRSSSLAPTPSWQGAPRRSVLDLWDHYLHCLLNKESQEYPLQREQRHIFISDHSKCHVVTNIKISRVSWNWLPSRDVLSTSLEETSQSHLTGSSLEQPCLISQLALL